MYGRACRNLSLWRKYKTNIDTLLLIFAFFNEEGSSNIQYWSRSRSDASYGLRVQVPPDTFHARMVELVYTVALEATAEMHESSSLFTSIDTKIATQAHSFMCGLVAQQYKLFNKLNYIFNFTMEIFTYAI